MNLSSKIIPFVPAICWLIIITVLLCLPGNDLPEKSFLDIPYFDKVVHFVMFFVLTYLFSKPIQQQKLAIYKNDFFFYIALITLAYGVIMEMVQKYFVPNRSYDIIDILVDGLGCFGAYFWSITFFKFRQKIVAKK